MNLRQHRIGARLRGIQGAMLVLAFSGLGCDAFGVKRAYLALDAQGDRKREHFFTDTEAIFCVAELASGIDDLTVTAELRQLASFSPLDGTRTSVDARSGVSEIAPGAGEDLLVAFELERPSRDAPYPAGLFRCELSLNGELEVELDFRIDYPECPVVPVLAGIPCAGFVLFGATCSDIAAQPCVCGESGTWECP